MRRLGRLLMGMALCSGTVPGFANIPEPTLRDKQQAACYDDVMKLCAEFVPDVERVTACMAPKRRLVSPACAAFFPKGR